jgi:hypothetical protein
MDVAPALPDNHKPEPRERLDYFPRGEDGKPCHDSDLNVENRGPSLSGNLLKQ